jgi:transposase
MNSAQELYQREARRIRAYELRQAGWKQKDIALALGVTKGAVSQWMSRAREGGVEALRRHPSPGAVSRLSAEQISHCMRSAGIGKRTLIMREERRGRIPSPVG